MSESKVDEIIKSKLELILKMSQKEKRRYQLEQILNSYHRSGEPLVKVRNKK